MNNEQKHSFQAEINQLMDLMVNSLYSNKEVFLRELISNAQDAVDKLKFIALADDQLLAEDPDLQINIKIDKKKRTITISDNGVGMSEKEVIQNIGTIANSGTRKFLKKNKENADAGNLIGQFGVGFYSSFMVANKVELITRKAGNAKTNGVRWTSTGKGGYTLEKEKNAARGTQITLTLKKDADEFLEFSRLKGIITKYSDHINTPILINKKAEENAEETTEQVNRASAFWTQSKRDLEEKDYHEFYQSLSYDPKPPLAYIHNRIEGKLDYTSLLFIPQTAPFDLWEAKRKQSVKLYTNRVFITDQNQELLPVYLRFVKGIIETNDLPLNVSREILQNSSTLTTIRKACVKHVLGELEKMSQNRIEDYAKFWSVFGIVLKEGIIEDPANQKQITELLRFSTTKSTTTEQPTRTLKDYIENMQEGQKAIYYITSDSPKAAKGSPHLEAFTKKNIEVLLLSDRIDEWIVSHLTQYQETPLKSIAKGNLEDLDSKADKTQLDKATKNYKETLEKMKEHLKDEVQSVRISNRLHTSPSCLIVDENAMSENLSRIMKSMGQSVANSKPILEINPNHKLVKNLHNKFDPDLAWVLYDQAILSEGGQVKQPAKFVERLNRLLAQ